MNSESQKFTKTKALIEQHIHGGFGVDFANASAEEILHFSQKIAEYGVCEYYPTLATDSVENLKKQISIIKQAQSKIPDTYAQIGGIHLEACFLNPQKKGIHDEKQLLSPTVENFKKIEDEIIKIVTIAPELDENFELCNYLKSKSITVSAGHCLATDLSAVEQVTHLYNAMGEFSHRNPSTVISALTNNNITVELIADLRHVQKDVIAMTFKLKPHNKIRIISDALPITHSQLTEMEFCSKKIFLKDGLAVDKNGTLAGSTMFVSDMIKLLVENNLIKFESAVAMAECQNTEKYIYWDENYNIVNY